MSNKSTVVRNIAQGADESFGDRLRRLIGDASAREWALETGLVPRTVNDWLASGRTPHESSLRPIADRYGSAVLVWLREGGAEMPRALVGSEERTPYRVPGRKEALLRSQVAEMIESMLRDRGAAADHEAKALMNEVVYNLIVEGRDETLTPRERRVLREFFALLIRWS